MEIEKLMACYCKAREVQSFYTNCLASDSLSPKERDLLINLIQNTSISSNLLREYCQIHANEI
ncbi:hypothetical protein JIN86_18775 [Lysinibacillus sp. HST-98]|uniref:hypothetical protein n=1 Tax=Lysinibacillus TaxID=400634 RepID=UPI001928D55E|nr:MULTISPECIES: hypothetical protein [Lysinibacillus]MBL3731636.1 hypothetical protein [Lysinibacillus sp. HST-98]QSB10823.1 hypothetical protein JTI58_03870 [Lysinibacillus fusiformis]